MIFFTKLSKKVAVLMLCSFVLAFVIDGLASSQTADDPENGQVLEAGIWNSIVNGLKKIGTAIYHVAVCGNCLINTYPLEWGSCGPDCWW